MNRINMIDDPKQYKLNNQKISRVISDRDRTHFSFQLLGLFLFCRPPTSDDGPAS